MTKQIRFYEELSLNSHVALHSHFYDGWVILSSNGYTGRANSVNLLYPSTLSIGTKIDFCEKFYDGQKQDCIFKITDDDVADGLDGVLEQRGYKIVTPTDVMVMDLGNAKFGKKENCDYGNIITENERIDDDGKSDEERIVSGNTDLGKGKKPDNEVIFSEITGFSDGKNFDNERAISENVKFDVNRKSDFEVMISESTDEWISDYCSLKSIADEKTKSTISQMLGLVQNYPAYCKIVAGGKTIACASSVIERGYMMLHNVIVDKNFRGKGYGKLVCESLLLDAKKHGAHTAYLQVVQDNGIAKNMYAKVGFEKLYSYWYRVKESLLRNSKNEK